jgi:hypothetical protein
MKKISLILPARNNIKAFYDLMYNIIDQTKDPAGLEVLVAIDNDDEVFMDCRWFLESKFNKVHLAFFFRDRSDYFTRDYWNFLARKAQGRFIVNTALGCKITTPGWDVTVYNKMDAYAREVGDDIIHGLIKDNIRRTDEDPLYPHFSCHPVLSRKHVEALGYLFDERYWAWGCDPAVTIVYKALSQILNQRRIVSLTEVEIIALDSIHTTKETDEEKLKVMRSLDKGYQHFLRINQEHPYSMTPEDAAQEARKLCGYIKNER